jgi:hypothetical protein
MAAREGGHCYNQRCHDKSMIDVICLNPVNFENPVVASPLLYLRS